MESKTIGQSSREKDVKIGGQNSKIRVAYRGSKQIRVQTARPERKARNQIAERLDRDDERQGGERKPKAT